MFEEKTLSKFYLQSKISHIFTLIQRGIAQSESPYILEVPLAGKAASNDTFLY